MDYFDGWSEFNLAIAGAAAALAGLVIVAASVNIADIVKSRTLTSRLGSAIVNLVVALVVSALELVPGISALWFGVIVVALAAISVVFHIQTARLLTLDPNGRDQARFAKATLGFLPGFAYIVAGGLAIASQPSAPFVAAAGALTAIVAALIVSWVALVEVLR